MTPSLLPFVLASLLGLAWGLEGVAIAATINILIHAVVGLVVLQRFLGIRVRVFAASIAPLLVSCACMAVAVVLVRATVFFTAPAALLLVGSMAVGALVYGVAVYVLAPGVAGDVRRMAGRLTAPRPIGP